MMAGNNQERAGGIGVGAELEILEIVFGLSTRQSDTKHQTAGTASTPKSVSYTHLTLPTIYSV